MPSLRRARARATILAFALALPAPLLALELADVRVLGVAGQFEDNVRAMLSLARHPRGEALTEAELGYLLRRAPGEVRRALEPFGFYDTQVAVDASRDGEAVTVAVTVTPGRPVQVRALDVRIDGEGGGDAVLARRAERFRPAVGEILDHRRYEASKAELQRALLERGYFEAEPLAQRVAVERAAFAADIEQHWDSGRRFAFGETTFEGGPVREELLRRMLDHQPGESYHQHRLVELHQRLAELEYFGHIDIQPDAEAASEGRVPIRVSTSAAKRSVYRAGIAYGTDSGPLLRLGLQRRYVNDRGHKLRADAELGQRESRISGVYRIPAFAGVRGWWRFGAAVSEEEFADFGDSRIIELAASRTGSWRGNEAELGWRLRRERFDGETTDVAYPLLSMSRVVADDALYPRRGFRWRGELKLGTALAGSDVDFQQLTLEAAIVRGLWPRGRLLLRAEAGTTAIDDFDELPPSLRFFTGGDRSIRGYGFQEISPRIAQARIGGKHLVVASAEIEHMFTPTWGLAAFVDAGDAWIDGSPDPQVGVGLGLRWRSPVGPVRLDVAKGLDDADRSLRLHLNIGPDL